VWNILTGQQDAATQYLKRTTSAQLSTAFQPIIQQSLDKVGATRYYTDLSTRYNMIPLVKPVQTDLNLYATGKAIDGLFLLIAQEEANIRENPVARTTALLKRVFGS
jgi:predicted S18 family serine protease